MKERREAGSPLFSEEARPFLTVSELNGLIKDALEQELEAVWVVGEISNLRVPPSGHVYFTLKDDASQIAAVMFRSHAARLPFQPEDGMEILCFGRVGLYAVRGDLQLYVDTMEPRGQGALYLAFEQLRQRLWEEGLFDPTKKKPLPLLPRSVGIVTSLHGAALRDMLRVLGDRYPDRRVVIRPVRVQGGGAAQEIAQAIGDIDHSGCADVMIVGRGGGSLEDLWAFNEEVVARAIAASSIPIISAVGHEVDFTIADFVADHRAPTPTAAAEMVVPRKADLSEQIGGWALRVIRFARARIQLEREKTDQLVRRLADPRRRLRENQIRVDDLTVSLWRRFQDNLSRFKDRLARSAEHLEALSPLAVLERGYSIVHHLPGGNIVKDSAALEVGDRVRIGFSRGSSTCRVEEKE